MCQGTIQQGNKATIEYGYIGGPCQNPHRRWGSPMKIRVRCRSYFIYHEESVNNRRIRTPRDVTLRQSQEFFKRSYNNFIFYLCTPSFLFCFVSPPQGGEPGKGGINKNFINLLMKLVKN